MSRVQLSQQRPTSLTLSLRGPKAMRAIKKVRPLVSLIKECQRIAGLLARRYVVERYLSTHEVRKLQIGANFCVLPGWLNTDLYPQSIHSVTLDATNRFPLPAASFDYVFSEHQIEHIPYQGALAMLRESHRILRTQGKIRIALPSLDRLIQLFAFPRTDEQDKYISTVTPIWYPNAFRANPCFAINSAFMNWGHKFLYDRDTLCGMLSVTGFSEMRFYEPGQSDDVNLKGIEARMSERDVYETIVVEAVRS